MQQNEYSDLKAVWHPEKLRAIREEIITPPIYVRIKPMNPCNHNCYNCVYDVGFSGIHSNMDRKSMIPKEKMQEILEDFNEMSVKAITYSGGGEPLIYPFITETLKKTLESKIDLSIITNGQELSGERAELLSSAEWVRVSSNSCTPEVFNEIRKRPKAEFDKLINNIAGFAKSKKPFCSLGINFVVDVINHNQVYQAAKFYRDLGADNIKFTPSWSPNFQTYHAPFKDFVVEQIARASQDFSSSSFKINDTYEKDFELTGNTQRTYDRCFYMQFTPAIGADCMVYLCHNKAYDSKGILGSIKDRSFKDLWFSEEVAEKFKTFDPKEYCKHQCTNDKKNLLIKAIMDSWGRHVNFV